MRDAIKAQQKSFGERLCVALNAHGFFPKASIVMREFNKRSIAWAITHQTAGMWIKGKAIPGAPRLKLLADWLGTTPSYLLFGEGEPPQADNSMRSADIELALNFQQLDPYGQKVIRAMMDTMLGLRAQTPTAPMLAPEEQWGFDAAQGSVQP